MVDYISTAIISFFVGMVFISFLLIATGSTRFDGVNEGYKKAYIDYKENKIEEQMQEKWPKIWIDYNVKKKKEQDR